METEISIVDLEDANGQIASAYSDGASELVQIGRNKLTLHSTYREFGPYIRKLQIRPDDVFVLGYPRSGTTLLQEIMWLIMNNDKSDVFHTTGMFDRAICLEEAIHSVPNLKVYMKNLQFTEEINLIQAGLKKYKNIGEKWDQLPSPRIFKSHLTFELLPEDILTSGCKIIYTYRNVKDVILSFHRLLSTGECGKLFTGGFPTFWEHFKNNQMHYTPYWNHIYEAWTKRNLPNFLFISYEDLIKDLNNGVEQLAKFVNKPLTNEELDKIADQMHFENYSKSFKMYSNPSVNEMVKSKKYLGTGTTKNWPKQISDELNGEMDQWIEMNLEQFPMLKTCYPLV